MSSVIPTVASVVGSTVSSAVYTSIVTTGDVSATTVGRGLKLLGTGLGYGAEILIGDKAAMSCRLLGDVAETVCAPAIRSGGRLIAFGTSIVVGTMAGVLTAGIAHGTSALIGYGVQTYNKYKEPVVATVSEAAAVASNTIIEKAMEGEVPHVEAAYEEVEGFVSL